jgi:predicted ATP-dependent serine protease
MTPVLFICQDCGKLVDKKKRGRCLACYRLYEREKSRAGRVGTSVEQIDKTYGHVLPETLEGARTALETILSSDGRKEGNE